MPTFRYVSFRTAALFVLLASFLMSGAATAEDWPHWRGPQRDGHSVESSHWQAGKPWLPAKAAWTIKVGEGGSSPIIADGRLFATGWENGKDLVTCCDAITGKQLWQRKYDAPRFGRHALGDQGLYSGHCSTPEYDADSALLYTLSIDGALHCWDVKRAGEPVWDVNLYDAYQTKQRPRVGRSGHRDYGYVSSPLVYGDALLVEVGGNAGTVVAFDKRTGKQRWASAAKYMPGHTGGLALMSVEGVDCLAVLTFSHLLVIRLDADHVGKTVAEYEWTTSFANNIAGASAAGDRVLITSAYNHHAICCLHIKLDGATKIWEQPFPSKVCTPVVHDGHAYFAWRKFQCLDIATGKLKWEGGSFGDAGSVIVTADDRLIVWGGDGTLVLTESAKRSPTAYKVLAERKRIYRDDVWPHIALSNGRLYCKSRQGEVKCLPLTSVKAP